MHFFNVLAVAGLATSAVIPYDTINAETFNSSLIERDDGDKNPCAGYQHGDCQYDSKGNTNVGFSGGNINWGTVRPEDLILKFLDYHCPPNGGCSDVQQNSTFIPKKGPVAKPHAGGNPKQGKIVLHARNSNFKSGHQRNEMIRALAAAVQGQAKAVKRYGEECATVRKPTKTMDQWMGSRHFTLSDSNGVHQLEIVATMEIDTGDNEDVCADIFTAASAVAGAISGIAGGIFTLLGLTCDA